MSLFHFTKQTAAANLLLVHLMLAAAAVSECTMSFFSSAEFVCAIKIKKRQLGFSFFFFVREKKNAEKSSHQRKKEAAIKNE